MFCFSKIKMDFSLSEYEKLLRKKEVFIQQKLSECDKVINTIQSDIKNFKSVDRKHLDFLVENHEFSIKAKNFHIIRYLYPDFFNMDVKKTSFDLYYIKNILTNINLNKNNKDNNVVEFVNHNIFRRALIANIFITPIVFSLLVCLLCTFINNYVNFPLLFISLFLLNILLNLSIEYKILNKKYLDVKNIDIIKKQYEQLKLEEDNILGENFIPYTNWENKSHLINSEILV